MQQKLSHCRDEYSLLARDVSPRRLGCNTGIAPFSSSKHPCCSGRAGWEACTTIPAGSRSYFVVKKSRRFKFDEVRQRFRLTPTERRVAVFVAAAFVLGLITKCYRDAHPSPTPIQIHSGKSRVSRSSTAKVDQPGAPNAGETARRTRKSAEKLNLPDSPTGQDYQQK